MKVKFLSNIEYQTYPLVDDMVEVEKSLLDRIGIDKQYLNGKIVDYVKQLTPQERIAELKRLLAETDYQAIKHFEGYLTDYEYEPIKTQRQTWRDEINSLGG